MQIFLGSKGELKLAAAREALRIVGIGGIEIIGREVESGVKIQPTSLDETIQGARYRADRCITADDRTNDEETFGIGIESGILLYPELYLALDIAVIVITKPDCSQIFCTSTAVRMPWEHAKEASERGWHKTTVGAVVAEKMGGHACDPHSTVTDGKISRLSTLVAGLVPALKQALIK